MFKLKMIKKPILFKLKCGFTFPPIVLANMQEKEAIPTKEKQEIVPDKNYDGLSKIIVDKIPNEYIIPTGNIEITKNGIYNVREKETANVNIPMLKLGTKNITKNGIYKASDDELDGYSEVKVETSGVDINDYFETTGNGWYGSYKRHIKKIPPLDFTGVTYANDLFLGFAALQEIPTISNTGSLIKLREGFKECFALQEIDLSNWDVSNLTDCYQLFMSSDNLKKVNLSNWNLINCTSLQYTFNFCSNLTEVIINNINTSNVTEFISVFSNCSKLNKITGLFKGDSLVNLAGAFQRVTTLTEFNGFENLGKAYDTSKPVNYSNYTLDLSTCSELTHDSLVSIINNLYDINTKGCNAQQLKIGATNIAKLTSEELSVGTSKGWTVS